MRRSLVIALVMAVMQQWVGVNTLLFYGSITLNDVLGWNAQTPGAPGAGRAGADRRGEFYVHDPGALI